MTICKKGQPSVAVKIEGSNQPMYGRQLEEGGYALLGDIAAKYRHTEGILPERCQHGRMEFDQKTEATVRY